MTASLLTILVSISSAWVADGFIAAFAPSASKNVEQFFTEANTVDHLSVRFHIGKEEDASRLFIDGLGLDLKLEPKEGMQVSLPGANGPNPKLSSGPLDLKITDEASFIGMNGKTVVPLNNGCWELVWREDSPAGCIVCGFETPDEVKRNDATLPKGRIYVTFPVWTRETLSEYQAKRDKAQTLANDFLAEKTRQMQLMQETNNFLMKALHYRNAVAAVENRDLTAHRVYEQVPIDEDMVALGSGLLLTTKGTVWTKNPHIFGERQVLLGSADVKLDSSEDIGLAP